MTYMNRFKFWFLTTLILSATQSTRCDRMGIQDDGYARVVDLQQYPLAAFTLSGWVNVTRFPEGISPFLTYLSQDVNTQISFFIRPEGIGILWGGPNNTDGGSSFLSDRHPRLVSSDASSRRKREAGDAQASPSNLESTLMKRSSPSTADRWGPSNFVDVGVMGVDDLMLSGSDNYDYYSEGPNPRGGAYSDWTNVPYELRMEESIVDHDYEDPESYQSTSIITKPTDGDDYVNFNWNMPGNQNNGNGQQFHLGNNNWSPLWESSKEKVKLGKDNSKTVFATPSPKTNIFKAENNILGSNSWGPIGLNEEFNHQSHSEHPVWPLNQFNTGTTRSNKFNTGTTRPNTFNTPIPQDIKNNFLSYYNLNNPKPTRSSISEKKFYTTTLTPTTTTTSPTVPTTRPITTTHAATAKPKTSRSDIIPTVYRYHKRKTTLAPRKVEPEPTKPPSTSHKRMPLWKLIKKPSKYQDTTTSTTKKYKKTTATRYTIPSYTKPETPITTPRTKFKYSIPEPTLPPIYRDKLQALGSRRKNVIHRYRPVQSRRKISRHSTATPIRVSPSSTKVYQYTPTSLINKVPNYQSFQDTKTSAEITTLKPIKVNIGPPVIVKSNSLKPSSKYTRTYGRVNEFEKTMKDPKMIKEGNTAIVYAVPITNEKEFYEMYKKYQKDSIEPAKAKVNLHDLYNKMRKGKFDEKKKGLKTPKTTIYPKSRTENKNEQEVPELKENTSESNEKESEVQQMPEQALLPAVIEEEVQEDPSDEIVPSLENENLEGDNEYLDFMTDPLYEEYYDDEVPDISSLNQEGQSQEDTLGSELEIDNQIASLYKPKDSKIIHEALPSHYQEPQTLVHQQLPPYFEKPDKQYDFQTQIEEYLISQTAENNPSADNVESIENLPDIGFNPQHPLSSTSDYIGSSGLPINHLNERERLPIDYEAYDFLSKDSIPKAIHDINSEENPDKWLQDQRFENSFSSSSSHSENILGVNAGQNQPEQIEALLDSEPIPSLLDIHFEKLSYPFMENTWYHLTFTWNAQSHTATIYVNGERVGALENVLGSSSSLDEGGLFLLGKTLLPDLSNFDDSSQFEGEMSDLNLWATELPPQTVDALFQCKYEPVSPQPIDWQSTQFKLYGQSKMTPSPPLCGLVT